MACGRCKLPYPEELLTQMFIGGQGYTEPVCGICALEISNELHGVVRKRFQGEMAEDMRQQAIRWRKQYERRQKR